MYIRFVLGTNQEKPNTQSGVFTGLRYLRDEGELDEYQIDQINELFDWFEDTLECPPFETSKWSCNAVSWFKDDATKYIDKIRDIIALLEQNGKLVHMLRTDSPGMILYEDEYQVIAQSREF